MRAAVLSAFAAALALSSVGATSERCMRNGAEVPCTVFRAVERDPDASVCNPVLHDKCNWLNPWNWGCDGGSYCSGSYYSFNGNNPHGQCICQAGQCVKGGKCVKSPEFFEPIKQDAKDILCPVLASMFNAGGFDGMIDDLGRVKRLDVQKALVDTIGISDDMGFFFGIATANYRDNDPQEMNNAVASVLGRKGAVREFLTHVEQELNPANERYLNIFRMNGNPEVMHNIGAGLRNPTTAQTDPQGLCEGEWPCEARWDKFIKPFVDENGRMYIKQFGELSRNILETGEYGGIGLPGFELGNREWDALAGWLAGFGKTDEQGNRYMPVEWARTMVFDGVFPKDWKKAPWGFPNVAEIQRLGKFESKNVHNYNNIKCKLGLKDCRDSPAVEMII